MQDFLAYLIQAIVLLFIALMLFDFVTGLMPVAPAPLIDLTPIFEAIDLELAEELQLQDGFFLEQNSNLDDPWVSPISKRKKPPTDLEVPSKSLVAAPPTWLSMGEIHTITNVLLLPPAIDSDLPSSKIPALTNMTHLALTEMAAGHGIPHKKPGNKRKTKKELIADLKRVMAEAI